MISSPYKINALQGMAPLKNMDKNTSTASGRHPQISLDFSNHCQQQALQAPLWLCVYLPNMAAHSLGIDIHSSQAAVIYQPRNKAKNIFYVSPFAAELGININMSLFEAQKLDKNLKVYARESFKEKLLIRSIAQGILQFSSIVSIKYYSSILIRSQHAKTSLKELHQLKNTISHYLDSLGFPHSITASPVPLASLLLARAKKNVILCNHDELRNDLNSLDVKDFLIDQDNLLELHKLGIQRGTELFCLPSSSNKEFISRNLHAYLNELLGVTPMKITPMHNIH